MNHVNFTPTQGESETTKGPPAFSLGGCGNFTIKTPENFDQTSVVADGVCSATGATGATGATSDTGATGATSTTNAQEDYGVEGSSASCATDPNAEQESKVTFAGALPGNGKEAQGEDVFIGHTASGGWCTVETHGDVIDWFPNFKQMNVKNQGPVKWVLKILMERNKEGGW